ncbi:Intraflagellar transport protein 80 [Paragonimus heterotremus]|uniref:Intraflagellar transport protein 80 n=1 Tax=Paragonimus heterotremus TaxID=100268 RepID=A0A8J4TDN3_9TREM|nr:Intraflagellar transport protein 80 [Paragonimus heterotremus]
MQTSKVISLPATVFPTDMDCCPRQHRKSGSKSSQTVETFLLGATDGRFYLLSKTGKTDKGVEAHQGAVLSVKWNQDGTSFATSGEDGKIKVWSQSGMLRSTLAQHGMPIYSIAWGFNTPQIVFTLGKQLVLQSLQANAKPTAWKAHEGLILKVDWSHVTDRIISGAEDCKYKVWDTFGRLLYVSAAYDYPITSVAWSPDGKLFAVGSFNMLRLCDKSGWSYSVEKTKTGSLLNLRWSADSTQVAAVGGNGTVVVGQVIDRWMEWNGFEAAIVDERTIEVHNVRNGANERLDYRDRIPTASLKYNHLIVATTSQCYIYNTSNFNTPIITDLRESNVTLIAQCQKYFVLIDGANIFVYTYDARLVCSPKHPALRTDMLHSDGLALCNDTLAVKNRMDERSIYLFETETGKPIGDGKPIVHTIEVLQIGLDQCGPPLDRRMALLDRNKDLYLMSVRVFGTSRKLVKLCTMATSMVWSETSNLLAAVANENLTIWFYPNVAFIDNDLLAMTTQEHENQEEFGKQPELLSFHRDRITIRRSNGSVVSFGVSPYLDKLHQLILTNKWHEALGLCRNAKDKHLWACLAGFATYAKDLDIAEVAFAEIEEVDKVEYLRYTKKLPTKELRAAEMLLFSGEYQDAEGILLQAGLYFRAIMLHLHCYNWDRALELATKYNMALDIVVSVRHLYLQQSNRVEILPKYLSLPKQSILNSKTLKDRIENEYQREREKKDNPPIHDKSSTHRVNQPIST